MRNNNSQHLLSDYMYQVLFQPIFHVVIYLIYRTTPRGRYHYYFHFSDEETESEGLSFQGHTVCKFVATLGSQPRVCGSKDINI